MLKLLPRIGILEGLDTTAHHRKLYLELVTWLIAVVSETYC